MSIIFENIRCNDLTCFIKPELEIPIDITNKIKLTLRKESVFITKKNKELIINKNFFKKVQNVHRYNFYSNNYNGLEKTENNRILKKIEDNDNVLEKIEDAKIDSININDNLIIFILESPHIDEYKYLWKEGTNNKTITKILPIAPAQGAAGRNLDKYLLKLLSNIFSEKIEYYKVIIVNPIPYQCSLGSLYDGAINRLLRDKVWRSFWKFDAITKEFNNILQRFNKSNIKLIINACTGGLANLADSEGKPVKNENLNNIILHHLINVFEQYPPLIANVHHPSRWPKNRKYSLYNNGKIGNAINFIQLTKRV